LNSRDNSFLPHILEATNGRGVDVVLNSLSGELLHASWQCVANFGIMVEIGKRDFIGKAVLEMDKFMANRRFVGFDLVLLGVARPKAMSEYVALLSIFTSRKANL
jgi:NADPH:quinone reductase-like Zn-dependent oxidoreductase